MAAPTVSHAALYPPITLAWGIIIAKNATVFHNALWTVRLGL